MCISYDTIVRAVILPKTSYFQWVERCDAEIRRFWDKCIAGKFPNMLKTVRNKAEKIATKQGLQVGNNMSVLLMFKPAWIRTDIWKQMIDNWNTPTWKAKTKRNNRIRSKPTGGKLTLGSQSYATAKRKAAMIMGRETSTHEMWKQTHCRKGSRPLDKDPSGSSSLVSDIDSEGKIQEENLAKYDGYLVEKYRDEPPKFDQDLRKRAASGMKKGKVYGLGVVTDPYVHGRHDPEIEKLNGVIKELVKEKEEYKERFNEILTELMAQREKDKAEKEAILVRMAKIEDVLKTSVRK
ncbi:putative transposase, Ptta/En/Spm, plant [Helianthus anomalus]